MSPRPFFVVLVAASMTLAGCASTSTQESTGAFIDDAAITTKVKAALFKDTSLRGAEISVTTLKSAVQLSGFVPGFWEANTAGRLAGAVSGVSSVQNNLVVK